MFFDDSDSDPNWPPRQNKHSTKKNKLKKTNPHHRSARIMQSRELVWILARTVINLVKHQSKRSEIVLKSLLKHKELAYQQVRKGFKHTEKEVNAEQELDEFLEEKCEGEVLEAIKEFSKGGFCRWMLGGIYVRGIGDVD